MVSHAQNPVKVFVDADAFIALLKADDQNHSRATAIFQKLANQDTHFLTSNYAFAETVTVLSQRVGHRVAVEFIERIKADDSDFQMLWVSEDIEQKALELFKKQTSKNVSFMDCCHMACIRQYQLDAVFSFDHGYAQNQVPLAANLK